MKIGAQFYTLRDFCKTTDELAETLKKVADIGYTTVQLSGTCPYDVDWMAEQLSANGLSCVLTHTDFGRMQKEPETVLAEHQKIGCKYIGIGWYNGLREQKDFDELVAAAKHLGKVFAPAGARFMYHNHYEEMNQDASGKTRLLALLDRTTPEELGITLDTYWLHHGGGDLVDYVGLLKGRIPCVHLKDMKVVDKEIRMAAIGDGTLPFKKLLPLMADAGCEYALVEQDNCYGEDPFACLERSYKWLKAQGLD